MGGVWGTFRSPNVSTFQCSKAPTIPQSIPSLFILLRTPLHFFCTRAKLNSFLFKRFRILRQKTQPPRVGEGGQISLPASPGPGKFDPVKVALSMRSTGHATPVTSRNYPFDQRPAGLVRTGVG